MFELFVVVFLLCVNFGVADDFKIEKVEMKLIRIGEIGLNFDMTVSNLDTKATYTFKVGCEGCCVVVSGNVTECGSKMVGGSFGEVLPTKSEVITLVWPNAVIFNRIGYCNELVTATHPSGKKIKIPHKIVFNTTYDPAARMKNTVFHNIPRSTNVSMCASLDLNPLDHCSPINCEAKYFGKRNFFNPSLKICEPVPECNHKEEIYDYIQNVCVLLSKILTLEDLERLKNNEFDQYDWEPSPVGSPFVNEYLLPPERTLEEEALRKAGVVKRYALYFTVFNCAIVLVISLTIYVVVALLISTALIGFGRKQFKKRK